MSADQQEIGKKADLRQPERSLNVHIFKTAGLGFVIFIQPDTHSNMALI